MQAPPRVLMVFLWVEAYGGYRSGQTCTMLLCCRGDLLAVGRPGDAIDLQIRSEVTPVEVEVAAIDVGAAIGQRHLQKYEFTFKK